MDPVTLGMAKAAASRRFSPRTRSDARGVTVRPLPALPPIIATAPTRVLNPAVGSFTSYTLAQSLLKVTTKGGLFSQLTANSLTSLTNTVAPVTSSTFPSPHFIEFTVDDTFDIKFRDNSGSSLACIWLWVDNLDGLGWQRVTAYTESTGASALNGGAQVWRVTFASAALRKVRVFFKNCEFAGVRHSPVTTMQPVARTETKVALLGDSWMDSANGNLGQHSAYYNAALLLGMEPLLCGQAGTGYCTTTNNANLGSYGDARRTAPIIAAAPDYIVIEGSINDDLNYGPTPAAPAAPAGSATAAQITAAATALYATFATALPNTKLIVFGAQSLGSPTGGFGDGNALRLANNSAVRAAATAAPNVLAFVDCIAEGWISGTGNTTAATTTGNSDKLMNSTYHLSQYGHETLAHRIARSIADILNAT